LGGSYADGLAGVGLTLLSFASRTGDLSLLREAEQVSRELIDITEQHLPSRPGLLTGASGHALFWLRLYELNHDDKLLDLTYKALAADVTMFRSDTQKKAAQQAGLAGPIGTAMVIRDFLGHREDEQLADAQEAFRVSAKVRFVSSVGLFHGRIGTLLGLHYLAGGRIDQHAQQHLGDLGWHAVLHDDALAFVGEVGLKLSCDIATGSAGVLLGVHSVLSGKETPVPFFGQRSAPGRD
jgi:hypothetical protein